MSEWHEKLGEPWIQILGLRVWIHGRQFPEADDYWDGNWLRATAHCSAKGASVKVAGSFLTVPDIARWRKECEQLHRGEAEEAKLVSLEPELSLAFKRTDNVGHIEMTVEITPDHIDQEHVFHFLIDQSYLPDLMSRCRALEREYPVSHWISWKSHGRRSMRISWT